MRRFPLFASVILAMVLTGVFATTSLPAQALRSASFEDGAPPSGFNQNAPRGWGWENGNFYWSASGGLDGLTAQDGNAFVGLQRTGTSDVSAVLKQQITALSAGTSYVVSMWVRARVGSTSGTWTVSVIDGADVLATRSDHARPGQWEQVSVSFTATRSEATLRLGFKNESGKDQMVFFDNVSITPDGK
ncbi:carbohydrate-binding protein CenC [Opitutaceae bacterium TAV5]|nr:carbohydrate-binding protein CenC [Opitutaceae bacterium TAV5]